MVILYCNMNLEHSVFSAQCNSDPSILFVKGDPQEVIDQIDQVLLKDDLRNYQSLRIKINGVVLQPLRYCCQIGTILAGSMCLLPIFLLCCDCWKQKVLKIQQIKAETYKAIGKLLNRGNFRELFLHIQDNLLNEEKVEHLRSGVRRKVRNLMLINNVRSFDVVANNFSHAKRYFRALIHEVEFGECRWDKEVYSNIQHNVL